ncbi:MAG: CPBP family intramembrane metalloprotease, partial [Sedimentisphaerales bacterium]|nr:CPBP family intramembrane metalloprotease [Sedimentisphaerales bacterium]
MSNGTIETQTSASKPSSRLRVVVVLAASISALAMLRLATRLTLYTADATSKNLYVTDLVLPVVYINIMAVLQLLIRRTCGAPRTNFIWFRRTRFELAAAILLIIITPALLALATLLMDMLGIPMSSGPLVWADRKSTAIAIYVAFTFVMAVNIPWVEELFWRGCVQTWMERIMSGCSAAMAQAICFAVAHLAPFGGIFPAFILGLITGMWRWKRKTLLPVIVVHVAVNSLWCAARWP